MLWLLSDPLSFLIVFPGLLLSLTIHEFAHAWTADRLGDPTPRHQGRVTLNPLAHLDPLGTLALFLTRFGWGKPVEFDPYNLKNPMRDTAVIALAGPVSNLAIALVLRIILALVPLAGWLELSLTSVLIINIVLAVFNLVPVYPLDGSKILVAVLPKHLAFEYDEFMHKYGIFVFLLLLFPWNGVSPVSQLIEPFILVIAQILGI